MRCVRRERLARGVCKMNEWAPQIGTQTKRRTGRTIPLYARQTILDSESLPFLTKRTVISIKESMSTREK